MYLPKPPDLSKKPNQGPEIWCEFCTAKVHYSYVPHANKYHFDIISKIWPGCDECKMYFPTIQSLDSHNLAKHKVSTASFRNRKLIPNRRVFNCEFCPRSFVIARLCWRHAQKEHSDAISQLWLKCDVCDLHFPNSEVMAIHKSAKHNRKKSGQSGFLQPSATINNFISWGGSHGLVVDGNEQVRILALNTNSH